MNEFKPNALTFQQCMERIRNARKEAALADEEIITSRDDNAKRALELLETKNVPPSFKKWQLPIALDCSSQLFITVAPPLAKTPRHSHDEGPGIRFIASGSIVYNGQELTAGDWMYIPAGKEYEFQVGQYGAMMFYCYCCCCA
jgi:hypothetical protein